MILDRISHFFVRDKDLSLGKFFRLKGRLGVEKARQEIMTGVECGALRSHKPSGAVMIVARLVG
jgi:hypothetical protein